MEIELWEGGLQAQEIKAIDKIKASGLDLEYVDIVDSASLKSLEKWSDSEEPRIFVAAYAGKVRLIDNLKLN